jgi:hypothetical protein
MTYPTAVPWLALWRLLLRWGDKVLLVVVIIAPAIGWMCLDSRRVRPSRSHESKNFAGSGTLTHVEVVDLWVPETMLDAGRRQPDCAAAPAYAELRSTINRRTWDNLWYALTIRAYQVDGGAADITFIRHPFREPCYVKEFHHVLAAAAGISPRHSTVGYNRAEVHILPVDVAEREPREVMEALLFHPFPPGEPLP